MRHEYNKPSLKSQYKVIFHSIQNIINLFNIKCLYQILPNIIRFISKNKFCIVVQLDHYLL